MRRFLVPSLLIPAFLLSAVPSLAADDEPPTLADLVEQIGEIEIETHSAEEYAAAADAYRAMLPVLDTLDTDDLSLDDRIDLDLLRSWLEIRLFEIEEVRLHEQVPVRYLALGSTSSLFLRPCAHGSEAVREAVEELERLPAILENARENLKRPARVWTENALYTGWYAEQMLRDEITELCIDDPELETELLTAAAGALEAVEDYRAWLRTELLPRSTRSPAWKPEEVERYQYVQEKLHDYGVDEMLRIAAAEESLLLEEMTELAGRIHPSGDLDTVWELMKEEAPPWEEVLPMAQRYVDLAADWLAADGSHIIGIPEKFDYGAVLTSPMGRRILSFGGADYGPTVAGRISGYYVLTPLESRLSEEEKASRIRSYNPYWTHVISYHEWVGHNVQRAWAEQGPARPVRKLYRSAYLSQAWSFYLEKLFEDEGYFETLPYMEELKTRMARLQMRMWRVQRILTKLKMAKGEMSFDQAVQAYIDKIGMEPTNAFIEVQRDCQTPASPGREIIGERVLLEMRDEYERRMGSHYEMRDFHEALLSQGELPLPTLRRILFRD